MSTVHSYISTIGTDENDRKKTFLSNLVLGAVAAIGIGLGSPTGAVAQDVTLKMHQFLPANANAPKLVLDVWAQRVEQDSGGRIQIDHYPSMQLGGRPLNWLIRWLTVLLILSGP